MSRTIIPKREGLTKVSMSPRFKKYWFSNAILPQTANSLALDPTPALTRPSIAKAKKRSSLRVSFSPGGTSMTEDDNDSAGSAVFTPKKSALSRQAVEKNALRRVLASSLSSEHLPFRQPDDRPSYSKDHLDELKSSTPSTPKDLTSLSDAEGPAGGKTLDLAAKFGVSLSAYSSNNALIPTAAEIQEKKARRARLAKEREFIALSDEDDEDPNEISLLPRKQKPAETRLVHDDEEIAEGFDEFVEDPGRIALGRNAAREQKRKHEAEVRQLIREAEGSSDADSTDDSEAERRAAYEAAQTKAGMDGLQKDGDMKTTNSRRPRTPPKITPLPSLAACLERLQATLSGLQRARAQKVQRMEEVQREKADIREREGEIQRLLREAGERYEKLRDEAGLGGGGVAGGSPAGEGLPGKGGSDWGLHSLAGEGGTRGFEGGAPGRGLESLGNEGEERAVGL